MATFHKRRNGDGSTSWDAMVRVVGYPTTSKSFRHQTRGGTVGRPHRRRPAGPHASLAPRNDARAPARRRLARLTNPTAAVFAYWRAELGDVRSTKITPGVDRHHRDRLLGAACRGHRHKRSKPRSPATVRNYSDRARAAIRAGGQGTARHGVQPMRQRHEAEGVDRGCALALRRRTERRCSPRARRPSRPTSIRSCCSRSRPARAKARSRR